MHIESNTLSHYTVNDDLNITQLSALQTFYNALELLLILFGLSENQNISKNIYYSVGKSQGLDKTERAQNETS